MAIASIALFFNNKQMFSGGPPLKIRRGLAAKLIIDSCVDIEALKATYQEYIYAIHAANHVAVGAENTHDTSFVKVAVALGGIQRWINIHGMMHGGGRDDGLEIGREQRRGWSDVMIVCAVVCAGAWSLS
jgi:hypothetical protein